MSTKRERLTKRNQAIHDRKKALDAKKTKQGKPVYTYQYILEQLADEFPPLSTAYIQQILTHEPDKFPSTKPKKKRKCTRKQ